MDFILSFDWNESRTPREFINEEELNDCAIVKILNGEFRDPLQSSDSEGDDDQRIKKAAEVLKSMNIRKLKSLKNSPSKIKTYIPGLKSVPAYPQLSELSFRDHNQMLRVLAAKDSSVNGRCIDSPQQEDHFAFEKFKAVYHKEQEEFIKWAHTAWQNGICMRMLKISPLVEKIYECDLEIDQQYLHQIPQNYHMCRPISMNTPEQTFKLELITNFSQKVKSLQPIKLPTIDKKFTIFTNKIPEPKTCQQHSLNYILPGESCATDLSLPQVHQKLANFAANNESFCVISSSALKTLVQENQSWMLPITVKDGVWKNGDTKPVVIIDNEITPQKCLLLNRTKRAFELMLRYALFRESQEAGLKAQFEELQDIESASEKEEEDMDDSDEEKLIMDIDVQNVQEEKSAPITRSRKASETQSISDQIKPEAKNLDTRTVSCTCSESEYGKKFTRSYRKWILKPKPGSEGYTIPIIVHASHKIAREDGKEVVLNPIPEYIPEFGATGLTRGELTAKVLDLHLRDNSRLLTAHIDSSTGDIMKFEWNTEQGLEKVNNNKLMENASNIIYSVVSQLVNLVPGQYILQHAADRGSSATLFQARPVSQNTPKVHYLSFAELKKADLTELETTTVQTPPNLSGELLPYHLHRKILPLAFTPHRNQVRIFNDKKKKERLFNDVQRKKEEQKKKANVTVNKIKKKRKKKKKSNILSE